MEQGISKHFYAVQVNKDLLDVLGNLPERSCRLIKIYEPLAGVGKDDGGQGCMQNPSRYYSNAASPSREGQSNIQLLKDMTKTAKAGPIDRARATAARRS